MIITSIEQLLDTTLASHTRELVRQHAGLVQIPAGHTVLREGDRAGHLYLIIKGIVRGYYIDEQGNDITKCFSMDGSMFSSEGLRTQSPSTFTIECLETCQCIKLPYPLLHKIMESDKAIHLHIDNFFLREIANLEFRSRDLIIKSAEERYRQFCKQYPGLHERVPLKYIASYIGVRPSSLSRIRSQLKNHSEH